MLAISGMGSQIAQQLITLIDDEVVQYPTYKRADRFLFCAGVLHGCALKDHSEESIEETMLVNYVNTIAACERILTANGSARICIIGSESGYNGSYDPIYAGSKAALHLYIETRKLEPRQQLVGVSPTIISDANMTIRRRDRDNLEKRRCAHPKERWLTAIEVARLVQFLLYRDEGYITGTVVRMHGGQHC